MLSIPVTFFQNCNGPIEEEDQSPSEILSPVAFDTVMDTLSYMSCEEMNSGYNKRAYFSFKAGPTVLVQGFV